MYNHTLYRGRKNICGYFLKAFNTKKNILKSHINNRFEINGKQRIQMHKNSENVNSKNMKKKINK